MCIPSAKVVKQSVSKLTVHQKASNGTGRLQCSDSGTYIKYSGADNNERAFNATMPVASQLDYSG